MIHTQTKIRVRYAETDKMGIVHHQNYVAYFEQARVEMMDAIGTPYRELEARGFLLPVLELNIRYVQSNAFDDTLLVHCLVKEPPGARIRIHYEVFRGQLLTTTGSTLHGFINPDGRPVRPPKDFLTSIREFFLPANA